MPIVTCKVDFNVNDRLAPIGEFIDRLQGVLFADDSSDCEIDLAKCQYLGPDAVALLASILLERDAAGRNVQVTLPESPAKLRAFCDFSGLRALVHGEELPTEASETVVPLRQIQEARFMDAAPIIRLVQRHLDLSADSEEYLRICVNEVIQNIQDHADSAIGGVMSARYIANDQQVRVAIVDRGIGIWKSLYSRYPDTTPQNVFRRVLQGDYSAMSRPNNAGLGLRHLAAIIEHVEGEYLLISGRAVAVKTARDGRQFSVRPSEYPGTAAFFTLPMNT